MSSCLKLADFERFNAGELDSRESESFRTHLNECDACRVAYEQYERDQAFLKSAKSALQDEPEGSQSSSRDTAPRGAKSKSRTPKIEGYRITGVLGQGGMGIVYRAVQKKLNRTVALKVLPAMVGEASPSAVSRFRREATVAARLHHTNIVPIYDFGESPDAYYYAMELITGEPLNVLIERFRKQKAPLASPMEFLAIFRTAVPGVATDGHSGPSTGASDSVVGSETTVSTAGRGMHYYRLVARWMSDAAEALHYAHGAGIIHRDIKPGNLIVSVDGRIMVADFGLTKSANETTMTITGSLLGTLCYLSPEQAMARRVEVDHRTDIYSLGLTLYELLALEPAFAARDEKKVLAAIIQTDPVAPRKIMPSVPRELEIICQKAIEKSPDSRYSTARDMADDLKRYLNDLPIAAKAAGPVRRVVKFVRRNRAGVALAVALIAIVGLVFAVRASMHSSQQRAYQKMLAVKEKAERLVSHAELLHAQALESDDINAWTRAGQLYEESIKLDPTNPDALTNHARLKKDMFNRLGRNPELLEDANALCDLALDVDANRGEIWNVKGVILKKLGRYKESLNANARAVALDPDDAAFLENFGVLAALNHDLAGASKTLSDAARLALAQRNDYCNIWQSLAQVQLVQQDVAAIGNIQKAVECGSRDADIALAEARVFLSLKGHEDEERALRAADSAERMARDDTPRRRINRMLALAHFRNGNHDKAIEYASVALEEGDLECLNHLIISLAHGHLKHPSEARKALNAAEATWPEDLDEPGEFRPLAPTQTLWIEFADELLELKREAEAQLSAGPD